MAAPLENNAAPLSPVDLHEELSGSLASGTLELPLLPTTASRILSLCFEPEVEMRELAELVQLDPSLAANVLQIANSAFWGAREPIISLSQALARLGLRNVADIAVSVALKGDVFPSGAGSEILLPVWRHSAHAGLWAQEIARVRRRNVEGAFLAGLLHDIGKPVLVGELLRIDKRATLELPVAMLADWLDEMHTAAGARLLAEWGLPDWMVAAAQGHHRPEEAGEFREHASTTALADIVAHWAEDGDQGAVEVLSTSPLLSDLSIYPDEFRELLERRDDILARVEVLL